MIKHYKAAIYARQSNRPRSGVEVRAYPAMSLPVSSSPFYIAIMAEEHNTDWSGEELRSSDNSVIVSVVTSAFNELKPLLINDPQIRQNTILKSNILAAFKKSEASAEAFEINASLLIVLLQAEKVYIGSVGICKCFLITREKISQISIDDYLRVEVDGELFTATSGLLTNTVGAGKIKSLDDIHWKQYIVEAGDVLLLCNEAFHQNISTDEIIDAASLNSDVESLCNSLAEKAIPQLRSINSLALCLIRVL